MTDITVRRMTLDDLAIALRWAADEGWNPGLHDAACFFAADPSGFFIGERGGEPVSCLSVVNHANVFHFIGIYIVRSDMRRRGYGLATWRAAFVLANATTAALDAVHAQIATYARDGFLPSYETFRYQAKAGGVAPAEVIALEHWPVGAEAALAAVEALDRRGFPATRTAFLRHWLTAPGHITRLLPGVSGARGVGVIRPSQRGWKIGPLLAERPADAEAILTSLLAAVPAGDDVFWDVPDANPAAMAMAADRKLSAGFSCVRMVRGDLPARDMNTVFGSATLELG